MARDTFRFGVIADPQYADKDPALGRDYRASLGKLRSAVATFNGEGVEFVVTLGDLIDEGWESFDAALEPYERLRMPRRFVLGNHDFDVPEGLLGAVPGRLGLSERHHDFAFAGVRFVVLDQTEVSLYAHPAGSAARRGAETRFRELSARGAPNAQAWNAGMSEAQLHWLDGRLAAAEAAGEPAVVFGHYPLDPAGAHSAWGAEALADVLRSGRTTELYLSGHDHRGGLYMAGDLPCVTLEGMVETTDETAFAIVEIGPDALGIRGYGRATSRSLPRRAGGDQTVSASRARTTAP